MTLIPVECSSGTFGDCLQTCPTNCVGCHHVTGVCDDCVDGYEGEACAQGHCPSNIQSSRLYNDTIAKSILHVCIFTCTCTYSYFIRPRWQ